QAFIRYSQICRDEVVFEQILHAARGVIFQIESRTMLKRLLLANQVQAPQGSADDEQVVEIVEIGRAASFPRIEGKPEVLELVQGLAVVNQGGDRRNLHGLKLPGKVVLFLDLLVRPALGPVKLGNDGAL